MDDPLKLAAFVLIHGGTGALGLALLALAWFAAKSRAAVLFAAIASALLIAAQVALFAWLSGMSIDLGGRSYAWLTWSSGILGTVALAAFLHGKRRRIGPGLEQAFSADFLANAAVGLVAAYLAMVSGPRLASAFETSRWTTLAQPQFQFTLAAGVLIAWGITQRMRWAWWAALAAAAWKLGHLGWWAWSHPAGPMAGIFSGAGLQGLLLLAIVALLLVPGVRHACFRQEAA
jgi:hypothetical protein